jgi:hypothetical protein
MAGEVLWNVLFPLDTALLASAGHSWLVSAVAFIFAPVAVTGLFFALHRVRVRLHGDREDQTKESDDGETSSHYRCVPDRSEKIWEKSGASNGNDNDVTQLDISEEDEEWDADTNPISETMHLLQVTYTCTTIHYILLACYASASIIPGCAPELCRPF